MQILSIGCLLTLVLYLLVALTLPAGKAQRQQLFRMVYAALLLGIMATAFFVVFESMVSDAYTNYMLAKESNILRIGYGYLMLAIPLCVLTVILHMIRKRPRPLPYLIGAGVVIVVGAVAVLGYTGWICGAFGRTDLGTDLAGYTLYSGAQVASYSNALTELAAFSVLYLPFLFHMLVAGLFGTETRWQTNLHWISLWLNLAAAVSLLLAIVLLNWQTLLALGLYNLYFLPFVILTLLLPGIPLLVFRHYRVKEAIRNGTYTSKWVGYEKLKARRAEKKAARRTPKY